MAELDLIKLPRNRLGPSLERDAERLAAWPVGEILRATVRKPRNAGHHRKFFALVQMAFANQDRYANLDDVLTEVKVACGHYREHITGEGALVYVPCSMAFAHMDQLVFERFYERALDAVVERFTGADTRAELERQVERVLGFA